MIFDLGLEITWETRKPEVQVHYWSRATGGTRTGDWGRTSWQTDVGKALDLRLVCNQMTPGSKQSPLKKVLLSNKA